MLLATACAGASQPAADQGAGGGSSEPKLGGILRMNYNRDGVNFNPMLKEGGIQEIALGGVYTPLLRLELSKECGQTCSKVLPYMAEKWEVSNDGTVYTFTMRKGLKWQNKPPVNGRALTVEDVKYNLLRFKDAQVSMAKFTVDQVKNIETPDESTVKVTLEKPFVPFLSYMAWDKVLFHPKELVDQNLLDTVAVGAGPFMVNNVQRGSLWSFRKNPDFFLKDDKGVQLPYLEGYDVYVIPDITSAAAAFISGQLDMCLMCLGRKSPLLDTIKQGAPDTIFDSKPGPGGEELYLNNTKPPFSDIRARQALRIGLDVDAMISAAGEGSYNVAGMGAAWTDWTLPQADMKKLYPHDVPRAKQLLKDSGYDGVAFNMYVGTNSQDEVNFTLLLQSQMKEIGFNVEVKPVDFNNDIVVRRRAGDYQIFISGKSQEIDPDGNLYPVYYTGRELNYSRMSDATLDAMLDKQRSILNREERQKLIKDIVFRINDQALELNPWTGNNYSWQTPKVMNYYPHIYWGIGYKLMPVWLNK